MTDRPSVRTTGIPMFTLTLSSYFWEPRRKPIAHQRCHQLTAVKTGHPLTTITGYPLTIITWPYRGFRWRPIKVEYFLKFSADNLLVFKWSQAHLYFCFKFTTKMLCLCQYRPALLRFWFQTDPRCKNSASFFQIQAGKTFSYHGHVLVTLHVQFLCSGPGCSKQG